MKQYDKHIAETELKNSIKQKQILIAEATGKNIGWLRYNHFWDNTPFINMFFIFSEYRGNKYGTNLVAYWEECMKQLGFTTVMTPYAGK